MFQVSKTLSTGPFSTRRLVTELPTFAEAEAYVRETFNIVSFEADADYPGCADFFTAAGDVGAINPA